MLTLSSARVEIGARTLLKETSLLIKQGEKVALVGANGMGKTTLLRSIAGDHVLAAGTVNVPARTAYLRQETPRLDASDGQTALEYLLEASPLTPARREMDRLTGLMSTTTGDGPQQRGLAHSVCAHQGHLLALFDEQRGLFQERARTDLNAGGRQGEHEETA